MTVDSIGLEVSQDDQIEDPGLHQGLQTKIKMDFSTADNLVILPKNVLRKTHLQVKCSIQKKEYLSTKDAPHLYAGNPEEIEE